jgi:hypothetical protein
LHIWDGTYFPYATKAHGNPYAAPRTRAEIFSFSLGVYPRASISNVFFKAAFTRRGAEAQNSYELGAAFCSMHSNSDHVPGVLTTVCDESELLTLLWAHEPNPVPENPVYVQKVPKETRAGPHLLLMDDTTPPHHRFTHRQSRLESDLVQPRLFGK